jgi:putative hemolysin
LTFFVLALILGAGLFLSAMFSGSETGLYSVKRSRLEIEARRGAPWAQLVRALTEKRAAVLITILIGNNLTLELMTISVEYSFESNGVDDWKRDIFLALVMTPVVFLFGELLPKDLYRRRPHDLMRLSAPLLTFFRWVFWPLQLVLGLLTRGLEKLLGFEPEQIVERAGRMELLSVLAEGRAAGALEPHAEELARNALRLRTLPITRAMIPWGEVLKLQTEAGDARQREQVEKSNFTRLPVCEGACVVGYVHQLGVLQAGSGIPVLQDIRELLFLEPDLSVDRALRQLRVAGLRMAAVGNPEEPVGLLTLKDLVEEISGDLGGW